MIFFNVRNVNNISPNIYIVPGGGTPRIKKTVLLVGKDSDRT